MQKAFCLVAIPVSGTPLSKAAASLAPLVQAAKAARISGKFDGTRVKTVYVLSSEAVGPVCRYRCAAEPAIPAPAAPAPAPTPALAAVPEAQAPAESAEEAAAPETAGEAQPSPRKKKK